MNIDEQRGKLYNDVLYACEKLNYKVVSSRDELINNQSIVKYICPYHGLQEKSATGLKQGKKCKFCANEIRKNKMIKTKSQVNYERYYNNALNICNENGYELISKPEEFKKYDSKIKYKCLKHGIKEITYSNLYCGKRCPECQKENASNKLKLNTDDVIKRIETFGGKIINPLDYINQDEKNLQILCPVCKNNIFTTSLKHFQQHGGQSCENCYKKESVGERRIRQWLESKNINFKQEYWFSDCRDKKPLPFDFYILDDNLKYKIIEFDGEQHEKENHYFNNASINNIKYHDQIKNKYCIEHNIPLLRIKYKELNILEQILEEKLL